MSINRITDLLLNLMKVQFKALKVGVKEFLLDVGSFYELNGGFLSPFFYSSMYILPLQYSV